MVTVQIDAGGTGLPEDEEFGGKIVRPIGVLHRGDVVLADVEEHRAGQIHPDDPAVFEGLAGELHGHILAPGGHRVEEVPLEIQRLRSGELGGTALQPIVGDDGGEDGTLPQALTGSPSVHNGFDIVGRGGLALGTGNPGDGKAAGGMAVGVIG